MLTDIDIKWQADSQREHQNLIDREQLFLSYKKELEKALTPYTVINGTGTERLKNSIIEVDKIISL